MKLTSICVYCGSSDKVSPAYFDAAREVGAYLAQQGRHLVYGGGGTGLMGATADAALEAGGEVTGIIPEAMMLPELAHQGLTKLEVVNGMHARKARMVALSDAFIILPGGFGTLDEFFEILTWSQLGITQKPVGILNVNGYFDRLLDFLKHVISESFAYERHLEKLLRETEVPALVAALEAYEHPGLSKWD